MSAHVAIAILNYNGRHYLEQFLPFVLQAYYPNKSVWVIDNASTDDSVDFIKTHFLTVNVIRNSENFGFAGGYNNGFAVAQAIIPADYYVLLNSDAEVTPGFIEPVIALMEADDRIAFAQPKLLNLYKRTSFEYAGAAGGWVDIVGYPFCRGRILETVEEDKGQYDDTTEVFWASGCCLFARATVYHQLGGFYSFLFMQNEDIDLCWRARNEGYKIVACGQSVVYHKGGGSLDWGKPQKVFYTFRNNLVMITRNMPRWQLAWVLPLRLVIDSLAAMQYLIKRNSGAAKAVFTGQWAFLKWLLNHSVEKWPRKRGFSSESGTTNKLLVWQYFVLHRKTFTALFTPNREKQ